MLAERTKVVIPTPAGPPRSSGIHISGVIRSMAAEYGFLKKEWVEDLSLVETGGDSSVWWNSLDEVSRLRMSMGLAWEQWYLPQLEGVSHQPGEMCVEGIYMTHDGESLDMVVSESDERRFVLCLHEVKLTYKSVTTVGDLNDLSNTSNWLVLMQTKAYAKALKTHTVYLHILYVCGDYSRPIRPQLHIWKITYTQAELDEAWDLIKGYLKHYAQQEAETLMIDTYNGGH